MSLYALKINNLSKIYSNKIQALKNFNLNIKKGDFYALLGPNGAGKTTVIKIISSLINKSSGKINVFNYDLIKNTFQVKKLIGLVPQEFNFNPFETVIQILINQAGYYGIRKKNALIKIEKYLNKLSLWKQRNYKAQILSGGMKRRLMIIKSLIHNPKLLILDEPTVGIDLELRHNIWSFLKDLNYKKGITIILTTHYLEEAEILCRNIGIMNKGILIKNFSIKKLLSQLKYEILILNYYSDNKIIPILHGFKYKVIDTNTLEIEVFKEQVLNDIFKQLTKQNIRIISINNKYNRLEKLFLDCIN
ncbi:ATP-binding cassette domain-containing protein [Enterobacteriaceae endosymbiont of Plateumaris pusilla]|uniref:ABC transporter ATP-binding protein n=1 Tax=Enterobacteriaceae endosymbiont of Plateumaris pusilla TaxID=2675795 RepID=UPI001449B442|nr:ABC transporter ATP-binding protein [Enterobacteriaceae endosymbiont of Plateumaris pusilla]QJC29547.1 ATP-binding cassette domain-containing protein [Enterobacteriaceae endosymbiont of Plateumaris pusilla]